MCVAWYVNKQLLGVCSMICKQTITGCVAYVKKTITGCVMICKQTITHLLHIIYTHISLFFGETQAGHYALYMLNFL